MTSERACGNMIYKCELYLIVIFQDSQLVLFKVSCWTYDPIKEVIGYRYLYVWHRLISAAQHPQEIGTSASTWNNKVGIQKVSWKWDKAQRSSLKGQLNLIHIHHFYHLISPQCGSLVNTGGKQNYWSSKGWYLSFHLGIDTRAVWKQGKPYSRSKVQWESWIYAAVVCLFSSVGPLTWRHAEVTSTLR